jgi:hypothetical protein
MRALPRLWRTVEAAPVLAGVEVQWREWLGDELEAARCFLRPEPKLAAVYPCPGGGAECPRRVVVHGRGDIVAACGNVPVECEAVRLKRADLVVYQFDSAGFGEQVAQLLELDDASGEAVNGIGGAYALGSIVVATQRVPVFLVLKAGSNDEYSIERLLGRHLATPLLLVLPTTRMPVAARGALDARGCGVVACGDFVAWDSTRGLIATQPAAELLASFRGRYAYKAATVIAPMAREPISLYGARALAFTHDVAGVQVLGEAEYETLVAKRDSFDSFVDGLGTRCMVRRRSKSGKFEEAALTVSQFEMLCRYVERRARGEGPCIPVRLGITHQSPEAARKTFIRMRKKVDFQVQGQEYRLFKQRRRLEGGGSEYAFEPDKSVRFCILAPPA